MTAQLASCEPSVGSSASCRRPLVRIQSEPPGPEHEIAAMSVAESVIEKERCWFASPT